MRSTRLKRILRDRYRQGATAPEGSVLEARLLAAYRTRYPRKRWIMNRSTLVIAALAMLVLGVAACNIPTEFQAEMGQSLSIVLPEGITPPDVQAGLDHLTSRPGVEQANVNVRMSPEGSQVDLMLWGQGLDADAMIADLVRDFPVFQGAEFAVRPLEATVEGPLYERIGHGLFGIDFEIVVEGQTEEEIRASILEQMAAAGIEGDVEVQMEQTGDQQQVEITIEAQEEPE